MTLSTYIFKSGLAGLQQCSTNEHSNLPPYKDSTNLIIQVKFVALSMLPKRMVEVSNCLAISNSKLAYELN